MKMITLRCPCCTGVIEMEASLRRGICPYCNTPFLFDSETHTTMVDVSFVTINYPPVTPPPGKQKTVDENAPQRLQDLVDSLKERDALDAQISKASDNYTQSIEAIRQFHSAEVKLRSYAISLMLVLFGFFALFISLGAGILLWLTAGVSCFIIYYSRKKQLSSHLDTRRDWKAELSRLQQQREQYACIDFTGIPEAYQSQSALERLAYDLKYRLADDIPGAIKYDKEEQHREEMERIAREELEYQRRQTEAMEKRAEAAGNGAGATPPAAT